MVLVLQIYCRTISYGDNTAFFSNSLSFIAHLLHILVKLSSRVVDFLSVSAKIFCIFCAIMEIPTEFFVFQDFGMVRDLSVKNPS